MKEDRTADLVAAARLGHRDALRGLYDQCQCNGRPTELIEVNNRQLAATQKLGGRYVTLIGCESLDEVSDLMRALSQSPRST